jgi:DNA repair exonuclease SbcCD ATPase subunit
VHELEKRIAQLRLLLAEMEKQYRAQLASIVEYVVYREGDLSNALSLMNEVEGKLAEVLKTGEHLQLISGRTAAELEVLVLTKRVAEARAQLELLQDRQQELAGRLEVLRRGSGGTAAATGVNPDPADEIKAIHDEVDREIKRLNTLITEASDRAARSVQNR